MNVLIIELYMKQFGIILQMKKSPYYNLNLRSKII